MASVESSGDCSSSSLHTDLGGDNPIIISTFEHRDKVLVLLVHTLLHVLVIVHPLLDVVAENFQLRQLLLYVLRHLHLLQVLHPRIQDSNGSLQALLSVNKVLAVSLSNTKLVVRLGNGPRIGRQGLQSLGKASLQIFNSLLEVRILETHLCKVNQRLALLNFVLSLCIDDLGKVEHLPGLLKIARLLGLLVDILSISLHLVF